MQASDHDQAGREIVSDDEWRRPLLDAALRLTAVLGFFWFLAYLASMPEMRMTPETAVLLVILVAVWVAALRTGLGERFRLAVLQLLLFVPVVLAYTFAPPTAGSGIIFALLVLVSTLYYGLQTGVVLTGILFAVHVAAGFGWASGSLPWHETNLQGQWYRLGYWIRVGIAQMLGTIAVVAVALYVVRRAQRASRELRRSEQLLRTVIAASNDGIWEWNLETDIVTWSDRVYEAFGMTRDGSTITIERLRAMVHPDDHEMFFTALHNHLQRQVPFDVENRFQRSDGSHGHFISRGSAIRSAAGKPLRMVGSVSDVTERRRMDDALKASEVLLRQFVKHTPAAVAMFDTEMRYIQASDRWLKDYRLSGDNLTGRSHYEVFPDLPVRWKQLHQRVLKGAVKRNEEDCFKRADGTSEWLQWEMQPWRDAQGKIGGIIMFTQLVNERKRAEEKIMEQLIELQRWQRVTLGREERTQQLKCEVNELCQRLNEAPRYGVQAAVRDQSSTSPSRA
jgi:PAS domain S-box-containing protein